jgi:hypothetical protein
MFSKRMRKFLFAGALLALAPFTAAASDCGTPCATPCAPAAAPCAPAMVKVKVTKMVPVEEMQTVTEYQQVTEKKTYTVNEYKTVVEPKTVTYTEYQKVTKEVMEPRTVTVSVPVTKTVTENVTTWETVQVTEMVSKTVDKGHWECREVPVTPGIFSRLFSKKADPCDPCAPVCVPTKTVKCWVPCMVTECCPVTKCKKVAVCKPCTRTICTYECQTKTEMVKVCKIECVPVTKTCTVNECKTVCVPVVKTCDVVVCKPVQVQRKVCVMKPTIVEVDAPAPCSTGCGDPCATACAPSCAPVCDPCAPVCETKKSFKLFSGVKGLFGRLLPKAKASCDVGCEVVGTSCGCH